MDDVPRTAKQRMLAGEPYTPDAELHAEHRAALKLVEEYSRTYVDDEAAARTVLVRLVGELGEDVDVRPGLSVDYGWNISIGSGTFINSGLTALDCAPIRIGERCQIGPNVQLLTPTHPLDVAERRAGIEAAEPITLGDDVWLGGGVIVLPGVTIGANTVVGAGAVVTKDLPADVVAVGNPAKVIRKL
ncbi:MAG: sugar O-acetyltransferase [Propionibacteriaceae bacterium]|nr:sugar O-acetyltransferase [Propionibacteriaceae bacterium]